MQLLLVLLVCLVTSLDAIKMNDAFRQFQNAIGPLTTEGIANEAAGNPTLERQLRAARGAIGAGMLPPPAFNNLPQQYLATAAAWWRSWRSMFIWMMGRGQLYALHRVAPFRPLKMNDVKPWGINFAQQEYIYHAALKQGADHGTAMASQVDLRQRNRDDTVQKADQTEMWMLPQSASFLLPQDPKKKSKTKTKAKTKAKAQEVKEEFLPGLEEASMDAGFLPDPHGSSSSSSGTKPALPEPVARALHSTTNKIMQDHFKERLSERYDVDKKENDDSTKTEADDKDEFVISPMFKEAKERHAILSIPTNRDKAPKSKNGTDDELKQYLDEFMKGYENIAASFKKQPHKEQTENTPVQTLKVAQEMGDLKTVWKLIKQLNATTTPSTSSTKDTNDNKEMKEMTLKMEQTSYADDVHTQMIQHFREEKARLQPYVNQPSTSSSSSTTAADLPPNPATERRRKILKAKRMLDEFKVKDGVCIKSMTTDQKEMGKVVQVDKDKKLALVALNKKNMMLPYSYDGQIWAHFSVLRKTTTAFDYQKALSGS